MIEHLSFSDALRIMGHCNTALRIGGVLRIVVPDLRILVNDYLAGESAEKFVDRLQLRSNASDLFHKGAHHRAMYDANYLATVFRSAGFPSPEQKRFLESRIPDIASVEPESRKFESLYMEAVKG